MPIKESIKRGMEFIAKEQLPDGGFFSLASFDPNDFSNAKKCPAVFSTALILQNLNELGESLATGKTSPTPLRMGIVKNIKDKAAEFLLNQKSENWTFNYWARDAKEAKEMPYPEDMDDTSCALSALYKYDKKIIGGNVLGKFVLTLAG